MTRQTMILTLAKVIIAAAWADGDLRNEEVNSLKDLLFHLPDLTGRDWAMLEMYLEAPIDATERRYLVEQLQAQLASRSDRDLAIGALEQMIQADGQITEQEKKVADEIRAAIKSVDVSIFGQVASLLTRPLQRRSEANADSPLREAYLEDFIKNKVYYGLQRRIERNEIAATIPDQELRKLSLAAGMMARVAHVDDQISAAETSKIASTLQKNWHITADLAEIIARIAIEEVSPEMDYFRLTRQFFSATEEDERLSFLDVLFQIAAADGYVSSEEIEEIRSLSKSLKLIHRQFIQAKLKIPRQMRAT